MGNRFNKQQKSSNEYIQDAYDMFHKPEDTILRKSKISLKNQTEKVTKIWNEECNKWVSSKNEYQQLIYSELCKWLSIDSLQNIHDKIWIKYSPKACDQQSFKKYFLFNCSLPISSQILAQFPETHKQKETISFQIILKYKDIWTLDMDSIDITMEDVRNNTNWTVNIDLMEKKNEFEQIYVAVVRYLLLKSSILPHNIIPSIMEYFGKAAHIKPVTNPLAEHEIIQLIGFCVMEQMQIDREQSQEALFQEFWMYLNKEWIFTAQIREYLHDSGERRVVWRHPDDYNKSYI